MTAQSGEPPARTRPLPAKIGRYDVTGRLGVGAMGVVYSARDSVIDRDVAIKVMNAELEGSADVRSRFLREARIGGLLLHRNITTVLDMGEEHGRPFIVMELLHGQPLADFQHRKAVPLETKLDLMVQLCEGLSAAHAHDVLHRDIKPSNLFVQDDGTLKILDFGVSRLMGATVTSVGCLLGTPQFMAPEQATGQALDPRADLFSSSAVFYFLLSGRKPFAGADLTEVLRKVQREAPPPLSEADVPPLLAQIVMRGLAKNRDERPASMADVHAELTGFRRQWQAETRRDAKRAQEAYESLTAAMAEIAANEAALGMTGGLEGRAGVEALKDRYPLIADLGGEAFVRIPFRRDQLSEILLELKGLDAGVRTRLALLQEQLRRVATAPLSAGGDVAIGRADDAPALSEATVDMVPPLTDAALRAAEHARRKTEEREAEEREKEERAVRAAERAAAQQAAQDARRRQVAEHVDIARRACDDASWDTACLEAGRALAADPESADALDCLARARFAQICEAAVQIDQHCCARLLADARQLTADGRFVIAARIAERAAAVLPDLLDARAAALDALKARSAARISAESERLGAERRRIAARHQGVARRALARGDRAAARQAVEVVIVHAPDGDGSQALLRESLTPDSNPDTVPERVSGWRGVLTSRADAAWLVVGRWWDVAWRVVVRLLIRVS